MTNLADQTRRLNRGGKNGFALITDHERLTDPVPLLVLLPVGSLVVLRHYGAPGRAALAWRLAKICRARRLTLLIAEDLDLAVALRAGLHLPEAEVRGAGARTRLWHRGQRRTLSAAAHGRMALRRAAGLGADFAFLSPVFATASHPDAAGLGILRFRMLVQEAALPVWALGGVSRRTLPRLKGCRAAGIGTVGNLH